MKIIACLYNRKMVPVLFSFFITGVSAQKNIIIPIETQHNAIALQVGDDLRLATVYFGTKLKDTGEYKLVKRMYRRGDDYSGIFQAFLRRYRKPTEALP